MPRRRPYTRTMAAPSSSPEVALWDGFLGAPLPTEATPAADLSGQRVLITGAGGYLGAAVARALALRGVAHLCLLDVVEHGLYDLQQDLEAIRHCPAFDLVLGSVNDRALLGEVLGLYKPTLVLHAAALKHVPLLESNALAAAATNVLGTAALLSAVARSGVQRVLLCSTDKAVQPVGVMGATKQLAEHLALLCTPSPDVRVLRLCNVLGSTGSVAPLFAAQIARGQPLTVTDRAATRLWLSQSEAVRCLVDALASPLPTALAVPRHVQQHGIVALAEFMMRRAKVADPGIVLTGLRRGERLHESLRTDNECPAENSNSLLQSLRPCPPDAQAVDATLHGIETAVFARDHDLLQHVLQAVLQPSLEAIS